MEAASDRVWDRGLPYATLEETPQLLGCCIYT